ncbi:hypothetical protein JYU34_007488 [Plutella xylostella]|uniref:Uncharacterized protein n=1 Tax=Plutella xylostella TaxID=51655 RepID=A0ABQ7QQK4_PLUXY|nr:hypothetical protein JYU34_007488 [Plutella xylostella]
MPWESMDVSNQKTVKFFLSRIQTPIQLTAMGIVPVGVQTMLKSQYPNETDDSHDRRDRDQ